MYPPHQIETRVAEQQRHQFVLFHANAVLTRQRTAERNAHPDDFLGGGNGAPELFRVAWIVKNDWMEIAVARVKDIADLEAVLLSDRVNLFEGFRELRPRNYSIQDVIRRRQAAQCAEGVPPAFPQEIAFVVILRRAHIPRAIYFA